MSTDAQQGGQSAFGAAVAPGYTLTRDNGKEFAEHETIANAVGARFYFAHPYASWKRGLNENTNGLVRQSFPKRCRFEKVTGEDVEIVINKLKNRFRKCLGYKTPNEVFFGIQSSELNPRVKVS